MTNRQHDHDAEPDAVDNEEPDAIDDDELDAIAGELAAHLKAASDMTLPPAQFEHALDRAVAPCTTCGQRLPQPGRLYCQACLDAEWLRRRASDPAWYERHKDYHRRG